MKQYKLLFLLLVVYQTSFALKPDRKYDYRPENFGMIYKEFKVKTADNYKINTWFFPAQDSVPWGYKPTALKRDYATIDNKKRPTIIICPADAGNMAPTFNYAFYMCPKGYNIVTFDWRGFGGSDNFQINEDCLCYTEFFKDINAVIDTIKTLQEVDTKNIGIYGFSMSAFVSFPVFQQRKDLKCFIGRALSADFEGIRDFWIKEENRKLLLPGDYKKEYYPINVASKVTKPCLFITGELDKLTPPERAQEILSKLKGEKEFWLVKNVGHGVEWDKSVGLKNYVKRMLQFYDKYLQ